MNQHQESDDQQKQRHNDTRRIFNLSPAVSVLISFCVAIHFLRVYVLSDELNSFTVLFGAFIPARYASDYAVTVESVTSVVTYSLLHGSFAHLFNNAIWLAAFGSPLASTIGTARFIIFWVVCAAVAALFHFLSHPGDVTPMIGASGAVSGCMGAAARFGFSMERGVGKTSFSPQLRPLSVLIGNRSVVVFLTMFLVINFLIGSGQIDDGAASIAWQAHIGGVVAGFLLVPWFLKSKIIQP